MKKKLLLPKFFSFSVFVYCLYFGLNPSHNFRENRKAIAATLEISKSVNKANPITGELFTYTLNYSCASLTEDCQGVMITDPLPTGIEYVGVTGSVHTTNEQYNSGTRTVTFTFVNPLPAGSTGQLQIQARFPNGITPNGTVVTNTATMSATNATSVNSSVNITASAVDRMATAKYNSGSAPDELVQYGMEVCNNIYSIIENGTLNPTNIVVVDTLPTGSIFNSANLGGVYNGTEHTVTWNIAGVALGACEWPQVFITYPTPTFAVNDVVTNTASITYTPIGGSPNTQVVSVSHTLDDPWIGGYIEKVGNTNTVLPGQAGNTYSLIFWNNSNIPVDSFYLEDIIDSDIIITGFNIGSFYANGPYTNLEKTIKYTTNLNSTWTSIAGSPFDLWDNTQFYVSSLGLAVGEQITGIRWEFGPDPFPIASGLSGGTPIIMKFDVSNAAAPGDLINCLTAGSGSSTVYDITGGGVNCDTMTINTALTGFSPGTRKDYTSPACGGCWSYSETDDWQSPGDTVGFRLRVRNSSSAGADLPDPNVGDLLPVGLEYLSGTWTFNANGTGAPTPSFVAIPDYKGTGRTLLRWQWTGYDLPPGISMFIEFDAQITLDAPSGEDALVNEYAILKYDNNWCSYGGEGDRKADSYDMDDDGDVVETFCYGITRLDISPIVSLGSEKLVKGQLDSTWTKYPATGTTIPGGVSDYRLSIQNTGNVGMTDIMLVDILPFVGDEGVIDPNPRNSRWRPNLAGTVNAPSGVTVYYSTEGNPCRLAEGIDPSGPVGCNSPGWSTIPPGDITTVQSLKFDFGSNILAPGDTIFLEWPMRAPVDAMATIGVVPDSIAWSSFGYIGSRVDNGLPLLPSEPVKVGITVDPLIPGVFGDWVWLDTNQDGIQNGGETGVDGVRIELYKDNGDGIANPAVDTFITFTVSANGGYYLFPNLPTADYFALLYKPAPYTLSPANQGGDVALDANGTASVFNGLEVAISPVTNITDTEYDYSWDFGIYFSGQCAIGNYVWNDLNLDGIQNESLVDGVNGITVNLYDNAAPSTILMTTLSQNDAYGNPGYYLFDQLPSADYFLEFVIPSTITFSTLGSTGTSDSGDSDANVSTGRTEVFTVLANVYDDSWDAAVVLAGVENCSNGFDDDGDGDVDCDDSECNCCAAQAPTLSKN